MVETKSSAVGDQRYLVEVSVTDMGTASEPQQIAKFAETISSEYAHLEVLTKVLNEVGDAIQAHANGDFDDHNEPAEPMTEPEE